MKINDAFIRRAVCFVIKQSDQNCAIAEGKDGFVVPLEMDGLNLIHAVAAVVTKGVTNTMDITVLRNRAGAGAEMLGTAITMGDEYSCHDGVVNTSNDDIATGDLIFVNIDAVHDTPAVGLSVTLEFG